MRIQSLVFARNVQRNPDNTYTVHEVSPSPFLDGSPLQFPARVSCQALVHLWRDCNSGCISMRLRFQLVDAAGELSADPSGAPHEGTFADGQCSCQLVVRLILAFPAPGRYCLQILPLDGKPDAVFTVPIDTAADNSDLPVFIEARWDTTATSMTRSDDPANDLFRNPLVEFLPFTWTIKG